MNVNFLAADYKESFDKPSCANCKNIFKTLTLYILINVKGVYKIDNKGPTVYTVKNKKICHKKKKTQKLENNGDQNIKNRI